VAVGPVCLLRGVVAAMAGRTEEPLPRRTQDAPCALRTELGRPAASMRLRRQPTDELMRPSAFRQSAASLGMPNQCLRARGGNMLVVQLNRLAG